MEQVKEKFKLDINTKIDAKLGQAQGVMIRSNDLGIAHCESVEIREALDGTMGANVTGMNLLKTYTRDHVWFIYERHEGSPITPFTYNMRYTETPKDVTLSPTEDKASKITVITYAGNKRFISIGMNIQLVRLTVKQVINMCNECNVEVPKIYLDALEYMEDVGMGGGYLESVIDHQEKAAQKEIEKQRTTLNQSQQDFLDEYLVLCKKHGMQFNQTVRKFDVKHGEDKLMHGMRSAMLSHAARPSREEIKAMIEKMSIQRLLAKQPAPVEVKQPVRTTRRL